MACQQFPISSPPPTFRAGPFNTLEECEQGCVADGACCSCNSTEQRFLAAYDPFPVFDYATEGEWLAGIDEKQGEMDEKAAAFAAFITSNGYACALQPRGLITQYPEFDIPNGIWGRIEVEGVDHISKCCGTIDTTADQLVFDGLPVLAGGAPAYPCIGPYTYDICDDGVSAEGCCGVHHPGQTCAEAPCECSAYCYEPAGFFCNDGCMCSEELLGVQCFYPVEAGGGECDEGCYPDSNAPGWCQCMDIVSFDDCVFTYDGRPPGYPITPEEEGSCAPHREQYGVCGGGLGFDVFRCVPDTGGNPLP